MLQTGDPLGNGTGGVSPVPRRAPPRMHAEASYEQESIWGGHFEDEFHPSLRHDRPYCLSMANAGPNTNGASWNHIRRRTLC